MDVRQRPAPSLPVSLHRLAHPRPPGHPSCAGISAARESRPPPPRPRAAGPVAKCRYGIVMVARHRIVDARLDPHRLEPTLHLLAAGTPDHGEMVHAPDLLAASVDHAGRLGCERRPVLCGNDPARLPSRHPAWPVWPVSTTACTASSRLFMPTSSCHNASPRVRPWSRRHLILRARRRPRSPRPRHRRTRRDFCPDRS